MACSKSSAAAPLVPRIPLSLGRDESSYETIEPEKEKTRGIGFDATRKRTFII